MTTFQDGPASGQCLMLKRAARFLRVVESPGQWDGLDQLEDSPKPNEKIYAYEITCRPGSVHIKAGRGRSGFYPRAHYKFVPDQPEDEVMRDNDKWARWCESRAKSHPRDDL